MDRDPTYTRVLSTFATYGFRKTAMAELAEAANVSRQTLYNRFQTKLAVLDWAVKGFSTESEARAIAALAAAGPTEARILAFFAEWIGCLVPLLHNTPHGVEIFEMAKARSQQGPEDPHAACLGALERFLAEEAAAPAAEAGEVAYLLTMVSKGLLLSAATTEDYETGMARLLRTALRQG